MKPTDKVLIGIVAGILILIVVALIITLTKPEPTYLSEDSPQGVVNNYLLALQQKDYERAYGYLLPTLPGYPHTEHQFVQDVEDSSYFFRLNQNVSLSVNDAKIVGPGATITVRESQFYGGNLFGSSQSINTFEVSLRQLNGEWKIFDSDFYFAMCWTSGKGCNN